MWRPPSLFDEMSSLFRSFDSMLGETPDQGFFPGPRLLPAGDGGTLAVPARRTAGWRYPAVESYRRNGDLVVRAELPGVAPEDVDVQVISGRLVLRGEKKESHEEKEKDYFLRETFSGSFERAFTLPDGVNADQVKASFSNGVLEVTIPAAATQTTRKVPIQLAADNS